MGYVLPVAHIIFGTYNNGPIAKISIAKSTVQGVA